MFLLALSSTNSGIENTDEYSKPKDQQDQNKGIAREKEKKRKRERKMEIQSVKKKEVTAPRRGLA